MNQIVASLVEEIDASIQALQAAKDAIVRSESEVHSVQSKKTARKAVPKKTMSAAARKRISESIRKRWADKKKAEKSAAK